MIHTRRGRAVVPGVIGVLSGVGALVTASVVVIGAGAPSSPAGPTAPQKVLKLPLTAVTPFAQACDHTSNNIALQGGNNFGGNTTYFCFTPGSTPQIIITTQSPVPTFAIQTPKATTCNPPVPPPGTPANLQYCVLGGKVRVQMPTAVATATFNP